MKSGMTRELIAGAMLLLASTPSQPETVNQYITDTGNPDLKEAMEAYAIGVGHGFFWYNQAMMGAVNRDPTGQGPLFCLRAAIDAAVDAAMQDAAKTRLLSPTSDDGGGEPRPDRARPLVLPSS